MSKIKLNPVRLFTDDDLYETDVDNRPILDLETNMGIINDQLDKLGFFIEAQAGPDEEPAGGFTMNTCAYIGSNSLLYPINISKSVAEIDYSKYPIVLVTGYNESSKTYRCLAASFFYKLTDKFQSFLPSSVGNLLKIGAGGQLVDEFFFDQYYTGKDYQHLVVGKIVTVKEIAFGGNQINVAGDSSFILKNHDDSTSGLVTVMRDNKESNVVFKSVGINTVKSPYVFSEMQHSFKPETLSTATIATPVFFTHKSLNYNQLTGAILDNNIDAKLNELHFKSPEITLSANQNGLYKSSGVTVGSLFTFASENLLHSAPYSLGLSEYNQDISTNLNFNFALPNQTSLVVNFPNIVKSIGKGITSTTGLPDSILPDSEAKAGITFGDYVTNGFGAIIESVKDNSLLETGRPTFREESDAQLVAKKTMPKISTQGDGQTLLIHAKSGQSGLTSSIALVADHSIVLSAKSGVHVVKSPEADSEVVNKGYLNSTLASITNVTQKLSLSGTVVYNQQNSTETDVPITGQVSINLTENIDNPSTIFKFVTNTPTNNTADIISDNPVRLLLNTDDHQRILFDTPITINTLNPDDSAWNDYEGVNKGFLKAYVDTAVIPDASSYVTKATIQEITGVKTFTAPPVLANGIGFTTNPVVTSSTGLITFNSELQANTPDLVNPSSGNLVATVDYVTAAKSQAIQATQAIWATWNESFGLETGLLGNLPPDSKSNTWDTMVDMSVDSKQFRVLQPCLLQLNLNCNFRLTEYKITVQVVKIPAGSSIPQVIASGSVGTSTSAAGFVTGYYPLNINASVACNNSDVVKIVISYQGATKLSGDLLDSSSYGYAMAIKL